MRVILLAGYRPTDDDNAPWLEHENGLPKLEHRVREARQFTKTCVVVLAGQSADRALLECPSLEKCELVFDTHAGQANLISNLRAALHLGEEPAIVLPAELPFGDISRVQELGSLAVQHGLRTPFHLIQDGEESFPLILTGPGCEEVMKNKNLASLADLTRHVPCL